MAGFGPDRTGHHAGTMWRRVVGTVAMGGFVAVAVIIAVRPATSAPLFVTQGPVLTDSDVGRALFDGGPLAPGGPRTACTTVTNAGPASAAVRLFGSTTGTGLDRFLRITVARGRLTTDAEGGSCRGFESQAVLFSGSLRAFPDAYEEGIADPDTSWDPGQSRAYRITVTLGDDPAAQGLTAGQSFVWEARAP